MASRKIGILAGGALAGALLLGTAGLVAAQDPTATPSPTPWSGMTGGAGMMGGGMAGGAGMMGAAGMSGGGMMGGTGAGMMGGQMGTGTMTSEQLEQMGKLHDQMAASGTCDQAQMQELHAQHHRSN